MKNTRRFVAIAALASLAFLSSCGRKPAQPYVAVGTLSVADSFAGPVAQLLRFHRADVVMTVRTTPDVDSVIVQRRWKDVTFPFEFGLGKGLGATYREKYKGQKVFVTAMVTFTAGQKTKPDYTFVGWTREPVDIGTYFFDVSLDRRIEYVSSTQDRNLPMGWFSSSVIEEAVPPAQEGMGQKKNLNPGPMVFSGILDVPPALRESFRSYRLNLIARGMADQGAPELVLSFDHPVFPFKFALHENHRQFGDPRPITTPLFIVAILDEDGSVDSKTDQFVAKSATAIAPETKDIRLTFDIPTDAVPANPDGAPPTSHGSVETGATTAMAAVETVVAGKVTLPDDLKKHILPTSVLYVSVRNEANQLVLSRRFPATFPTDFALTPSDSLGGPPLANVPQKMIVKVTVAGSGDVLQPSDDDLEFILTGVPAGTKGLDVVLKKK